MLWVRIFTCKTRPLQPSTRVIYYPIARPVVHRTAAIILVTKASAMQNMCTCQLFAAP
jgi:hypothetical protein